MSERIDRDKLFMTIADVVSLRSTCNKLKVGAILIKDKRIISMGYNGSPSGSPHCTEVGCLIDDRTGACIRTIHAEMNVIAFAAKKFGNTEGSTLYTTVAPCLDCSKLLINAGVVEVVYNERYRDESGIELLNSVGIKTRQLPHKTGLIDYGKMSKMQSI